MKIFGAHFRAFLAGPFQVVWEFHFAFGLLLVVTDPLFERPEIFG